MSRRNRPRRTVSIDPATDAYLGRDDVNAGRLIDYLIERHIDRDELRRAAEYEGVIGQSDLALTSAAERKRNLRDAAERINQLDRSERTPGNSAVLREAGRLGLPPEQVLKAADQVERTGSIGEIGQIETDGGRDLRDESAWGVNHNRNATTDLDQEHFFRGYPGEGARWYTVRRIIRESHNPDHPTPPVHFPVDDPAVVV